MTVNRVVSTDADVAFDPDAPAPVQKVASLHGEVAYDIARPAPTQTVATLHAEVAYLPVYLEKIFWEIGTTWVLEPPPVVGTPYPYQGAPANDGIINALGGQSAHPATLLCSQSSTLSGLNADNALSPSTATSGGRSHTAQESNPWWMVEAQGGAEFEVTHIAIRAQDWRDGFQFSIPCTIEGRVGGSWQSIGSITVDPGQNNWSAVIQPGSPLTCDAVRLTGPSGSKYMILGSVEIWGSWIAGG